MQQFVQCTNLYIIYCIELPHDVPCNMYHKTTVHQILCNMLERIFTRQREIIRIYCGNHLTRTNMHQVAPCTNLYNIYCIELPNDVPHNMYHVPIMKQILCDMPCKNLHKTIRNYKKLLWQLN
jgi:hypothetical protein